MRGLLLITAAALCGVPSLSVVAQVRRVVPAERLELPLTRGGRAPLEGGSSLVGEIQGREIRWILRSPSGEIMRVFPSGSRAYRDANDHVTVVWSGGRERGGTVQVGRIQTAPQPDARAGSRLTADRAVVTANAVRAMRGARARLGAAIYPDQQTLSIGGDVIDVYRSSLIINLAWEALNAEQFEWRWQVSLQPFPDGASFDPPGLVGSGPADLKLFRIGLGTFPPLGTRRLSVAAAPIVVAPPPSSVARGAVRRPPSAPAQKVAPDLARDFYIRIIAVRNGAPYGLGSNVVVAHYHPGPAPYTVTVPPPVSAELLVMRPAAKIYRLEFANFQPLIFEDPNRWGCIYVVKNPYAGNLATTIALYQAGKEYCPPNDPAHQEKTTWQWIETGVTGWVKAYEVMSDFYNDTKDWIADKFATVAVPCGWLGDDLESTCHDLATQAAGTAMSAGLVAVGVPPTLPSIEGLEDAGKEKFAEAAADYTCQIFESNGGECTPAMRTGLEIAYKEGLNQLQKNLHQQASEPGCGDAAAAKDNGKLPLPCFTSYEGTEVRPATGSIQEWPIVTVRVTQLKKNPPFPMPPCKVTVNFSLNNHFSGGYLGGAMVKATDMSGYPFESVEGAIPAMAVGESHDVPLVFSKIVPFRVPGHQALPQAMSTDWLHLYVGGTGPIHATSSTSGPVVGAKASGRDQVLDCADRIEGTIQIPEVP
jgi:hypothetical protein